MVPKKHKSKRVTCAKRYKIEKKVKEKHRKDRREAKKNPQHHRAKKDPGIPASWPYKEQLIHQIEEIKMEKEDEKARMKQAGLQKRAEMSMAQMAREAERRGDAYNLSNVDANDGSKFMKEAAVTTKDNSRRAYYREFRKVVDVADVLLEILDARDPLGSRARHVEKFISEHTDKRIVLVLNKIDLVPKEVTEQWLKYLRREFPVIPFKSSTQSQRSNLGQSQLKIKNVTESGTLSGISECLGADVLVGLLKNYARNHGVKRTLRVGVVGYPNVGKSSVINSLKRARVCSVGARPGVTKTVAEVALDKSLRLLDCPGIVFERDNENAYSDSSSTSGLGVLLRNCVKAELIEDPVSPVEAIVRRCDVEQLMLMYTLPRFSTPNEFLVALAQKRGKLRRGGVPDIIAAARLVLEDWNTGKIPFYTLPPIHSKQQSNQVELVSTWSSEFNLADVLGKDGEVLDAGSSRNNARPVMLVQTTERDVDQNMDEGALHELLGANEKDADVSMNDEDASMDGSDMEDDEAPELIDADAPSRVHLGKIKPIGQQGAKTNGKASESAVDVMTNEEAAVNFQVNRKRKNDLKQQKKKQAKTSARIVGSGMEVDDAYDFGEYFGNGLPGTAQ